MKKRPNPPPLVLFGILFGLLPLAACGPQDVSSEPTHERATAMPTTALPATATPSPAPPSPVPTPTRMPTSTRVPASTPAPASGEPTSPARTPTEAAGKAEIRAFSVSPDEVDPGDTVTLTWEATGQRAMLCPSARFVLFTGDDCRAVAPSGAITFTVPLEAAGFQFIYFSLTAEAEDASTSPVWQASVALKCHETWFFSGEPQAGICPTAPVRSYAAAQRFERGTMIWLEQPGRYFILDEALVHEGDVRKQVTTIDDPLEIVRDTASEVSPPEGFYAPASGFGLVWRGDVRSSPGYRQALGWALAPEFGYHAIWQCDDALPSGGRSWQTCHLKGPGDEVVVFHPLGGWHLLGER